VHPGETWSENFQAIKDYALSVRNLVAPGRRFGLGLRLSAKAAETLTDKKTLEEFKSFLNEHDLYVFTINGFSYGDFHVVPVKENVYQPDWRTRERFEYTKRLAVILSTLMPDSLVGSISTAPGSFKEWIKTGSGRIQIIENLMNCISYLDEILKKKGKEITLGLEPEPGCLLETTDEVVDFFTGESMRIGRGYLAGLSGCSESAAGEIISRHLGVCFDTCHMSVRFEDLVKDIRLLKKHNIRISKIQISAALKTSFTEAGIARLKTFSDPVYLHQVIRRYSSGKFSYYKDLPPVLENAGKSWSDKEEWRIHFHVPLYFKGDEHLQSTSGDLTPEFFKEAIDSGCKHFEIETYTFNALPDEHKFKKMEESIADEYAWVLKRIGD
jgi:sugar phosphate isomerase/epimerase